VVRFDGSDTLSQRAGDIGSYMTSTSYTWFVVFNAAAVHGAYSGYQYYYNDTVMADTGDDVGLYLQGASALSAQWASGQPQIGTAITVGAWHLVVTRFDGSTQYIHKERETDLSMACSPLGQTTYPLHLGRSELDTTYFQGDIAEILVYSQSLQPDDRTAIENYLCRKYLPISQGTMVIFH